MDVPEMVERVAKAILVDSMAQRDAWDIADEETRARGRSYARAAIEAITAGQFVEYRITSPDGELFAETAGTPAAAFAEAQHYAMQEPGAVIEQVVCLPALSPSLKEQERT